jgi:transcriptional regulator with XRE-family HTH domain
VDYGEAVTQHVAEAFRKRREELGLSLADVAEKADVHRSTIHVVESGRRGVTLAVGVRVARALGLSLGALVQEAEKHTT